MTIPKALYPREDVDKLHVSIKEEGRWFASIENSIDVSIQWLEDYIEKHERGLITATRNDNDNMKANKMIITKNKNGKKNKSMDVLND